MKNLFILILLLVPNICWATYPNYTVCPSGCDYTHLQSAISDISTNHATPATPVTITISGDWSGGADTTAVNITGITTTSSNTLTITTTGTSVNATGAYSTSGPYRVEVNSGSCMFTIGISNVFITGIQSKNTYGGSDAKDNAFALCQNGTSNVVINRFIGVSHGNPIGLGNYNSAYIVRNSWFRGDLGDVKVRGSNSGSQATSPQFLNDVFITNGSAANFAVGTDSQSGYKIYLENYYAVNNGNGNAAYQATYVNLVATDASADSSGSIGLTNIAYSTSSGAYFTNVTAGSENPLINSGSSLILAGTNLYSTFTDDFLGNARQSSGTWDVGAFWFNSPISHTNTINQATINQGTLN